MDFGEVAVSFSYLRHYVAGMRPLVLHRKAQRIKEVRFRTHFHYRNWSNDLLLCLLDLQCIRRTSVLTG